MGLRQQILRPVAKLGALHATVQLLAFLRAHTRTRETQDEWLVEFLAAHAKTDFARDHGLGSVRTYEEFRRAVPIQTYDTLRPYMRRVLEGKTTALLPAHEKVLMFSMTSGTTGEPKHIPVTSRFLADIRRGWNIFGIRTLNKHKHAWLRPIVQISSSTREQLSPTGVPCGAISGLLAKTQKKIVRRMYVVPHWAAEIADPATRYYTILRFSIGRDVAFLTTANPSSVIKLVETAQRFADRLIEDVHNGTFTPPADALPKEAKNVKFRRQSKLARKLQDGIAADGVLLPSHFWQPAFLTHWTGGTLKLYLHRLREFFPGVPIRDIGLLASEGRFSVPLEDETSAGVAEITSNLLEFIPADQHEKTNPDTLRAHELQVGEEYFLVTTNWAGLYRYNLDDRVRVVDFFEQSPVFEFLSRGLHTANITGEKITEHQVVEAMRIARRKTRQAVERFVMQPRFAQTPYYELRMEPDGLADPMVLAETLDEALGELNMEYASKRKDRRLGPIQPILLPDGALEQAERENIRRRHGRSEQYKHQYLLTDVLEDQGG
ncbi:MAG: GH3 auxin-responsive promoter family protein [Phycisphaerae bacterium]|nr:GH3 auxin-responsive promoter family protein [Phycisphaerae bacterium]